MKPVAAIIEPAQVDLDAIRKHLRVELAGERDDIRVAERHEAEADRHTGAAVSARASARQRRLRIGGLLLKARGAWPERGPNAKGWGEFLRELGVGEDSALRYMAEARGDLPQKSAAAGNVSDRDTKPANVHGGSGEKPRGTFCTPKKYALAVGPWDLDPFSNPRSHVVASVRCMLEDSGDGFGDGTPGSYRTGGEVTRVQLEAVATAATRVWIQPPYGRGCLERVFAHYGHARFCALLRFAPDTKWFAAMWPRVNVVAFPIERIPFETPDGVLLEGAEDDDEDRGAPFPHAFYYADERDVTDEIRKLCLVWRVDHALDCARSIPAALHVVR
jgi:hypothetical protein